MICLKLKIVFPGGVERQGSYYGDDVTQKATVAMVVDDPEQKEQMNSIFDAGRTVFALFHRKKISFPNAISLLIFRTYQW